MQRGQADRLGAKSHGVAAGFLQTATKLHFSSVPAPRGGEGAGRIWQALVQAECHDGEE